MSRERQIDPDDPYSYVEDATEAELEADELSERLALAREGYTDRPIVFSCSECMLRYRCVFAFDAMNLDGDCLMDK